MTAWREQRKAKALALRAQGLTQAQVAALVGVSQGRIAQWEAEAVRDISPNNTNTPTDNRRKLTDGHGLERTDNVAYRAEPGS